MPYEFYKLLHIIGIFLLFMSLGGMALHGINGGTKQDNSARKLLAIGHGIGLLLMLVAGFGLMARLQIASNWPLWIWPKIIVWTLLGGASALVYRKAAISRAMWFVILTLGSLAAFSAIYKPSLGSAPPPVETPTPTTDEAKP